MTRWIFLLCILILPLGAAKRVVTHEDIWLLKRVGPPVVSPDGSAVVFSVTEPSYDPNATVSDLWLIPTRGDAKPRRLTATKAPESAAAWSPDGTRIAFTTRREGDESPQIYILDLGGGEATRITNIASGASNPVWSPDGRSILFESMIYPEARTEADFRRIAAERKARKYNVRAYESMPVRYWDTWLDDRKPRLLVTPADGSGEPRDLLADSSLARSRGFAGFSSGLSAGQSLQPVWTPDGSAIIFAAVVNRDEMMHTLSESALFRVPANGGEAQRLPGLDGYDLSKPMFGPDGKRLYAMSSRRSRQRLYSLNRLAAMDWPSGTMRNLTDGWDRSVGEVAFSPDAKTIWIAAEDSGFDRLFTLAASGGPVKQAFEVPEGGYSGISMAAKAPVMVAHWGSAVQPNEVVRIDLERGGHQQLTHWNGPKLAELELPKVEHMWFTARNGKRIHSIVVLPPFLDKSKKYPVVLFPHGGPNSMSKDQFSTRWNYHLLTSPGYILVAPNYSGSTGFGEDFADSVEADVLRGPCQESLEAADEAIRKYPFADASRQAAMGASYGGYFMNWYQGHTQRFRALVNHAGAVNNESQYGFNDGGLERELRMGGPIWEMKGQWIDQSPVRYSGKWATPMLITQGENDFRVPLAESMTSFKLMQRRKIPSKLLVFPDENHWILKGENNRVHQQEVLKWLETYLQPLEPVWKPAEIVEQKR